jgi:nicotinamide-nucleotide amidase
MIAVESAELIDQARELLQTCRRKQLRIATAESCTGGLVAAVLTEIAGSSDVFDRAFVTYSNAAKEIMLGVHPQILAVHGAVSRETAVAMANGALARAGVDLVVAITGIAGPQGETASKPVGLVHFAAASSRGQRLHEEQHYGNSGRSIVRQACVSQSLSILRQLADRE